jgi:hypothetical protein
MRTDVQSTQISWLIIFLVVKTTHNNAVSIVTIVIVADCQLSLKNKIQYHLQRSIIKKQNTIPSTKKYIYYPHAEYKFSTTSVD